MNICRQRLVVNLCEKWHVNVNCLVRMRIILLRKMHSKRSELACGYVCMSVCLSGKVLDLENIFIERNAFETVRMSMRLCLSVCLDTGSNVLNRKVWNTMQLCVCLSVCKQVIDLENIFIERNAFETVRISMWLCLSVCLDTGSNVLNRKVWKTMRLCVCVCICLGISEHFLEKSEVIRLCVQNTLQLCMCVCVSV